MVTILMASLIFGTFTPPFRGSGIKPVPQFEIARNYQENENKDDFIPRLIAFVSLLTTLATLVGAGYKFAQLERKIYDAVALLERNLNKEINEAKQEAALSEQAFQNFKQTQEYLYANLNQKIDHKFERLHSNQKDLQLFLEKTTEFKTRGYHRGLDSQA